MTLSNTWFSRLRYRFRPFRHLQAILCIAQNGMLGYVYCSILCVTAGYSHSSLPSRHPIVVDPLMPGVTFIIIIPLHYPDRNRRLFYRHLCDSCGFLDLMLPRACLHRIFFVNSGTERIRLINVIKGLILEKQKEFILSVA